MAKLDMRLVKIIVLSLKAQADILDVLDDLNLEYVVSGKGEESGDPISITCPIPTYSVDAVRSRLEQVETSDEFYLAIMEPAAIISTRFEKLDDFYEQFARRGHQGISSGALHSKAADLTPNLGIYTVLIAISTMVATAGVLLNSVAVLVGSMVIAPLIGPPMGMSVATVLNNAGSLRRNLKFQLIGLVVGLSSSVTFALFVRFTPFVSSARLDIGSILQISNYTAPTFLLLTIALGAGVAGALSLATSAQIGLVGVMIAAALMPPLGVVGVGIAWGQWTVALGSGAIVLVNVFSILLTGTLTFWHLGFRPIASSEKQAVRSRILARVIGLAVATLLLGIFLNSLAHGTLTI